jgi:hypothetical protein
LVRQVFTNDATFGWVYVLDSGSGDRYQEIKAKLEESFMHRLARGVVAFAIAGLVTNAIAETRTDHFDADPGWEGHNNRSQAELRPIAQDFGYTAEKVFGSAAGAIGGMIFPDGLPAYYAKEIPVTNLDKPLHASGVLKVEEGGGNVLLGFFNSQTINEWRTPNTIVFRINGRGETFHVHTEYATSKWRAGAGIIGRYDEKADRMHPIENPSKDKTYRWTLDYDPAGNDGAGLVVATLNDVKALMPITPENRAQGMTFDRFGLLNVVKHADGGGKVWIGELTINGDKTDLSTDPKWTEQNNHKSYQSTNVRPRFDVGFSKTHFAKGAAAGEIGGLFFRGDCRYPDKLAYYAAKLDALTVSKPIKASGKVVLRRAISDSTTMFGFFHVEHSMEVNDSQKYTIPSDFFGMNIEGPSALGFFVYPLYRMHGDGQGSSSMEPTHAIFPDDTPHEWSLEYSPAGDGSATITLTFDGYPATITVPAEHVGQGATFNRFGFVTPWIDGNGQVVYFDDLTYTVKQ